LPYFALEADLIFPPPELAEADGLLAIGGDLSVERLLLAYRSGIFPWFSEGDPLLWWSPDPRCILVPNEMQVSRSLRKILHRGDFQITIDTAFPEVIAACSQMPRKDQDGTWIVPEICEAYTALHLAGFAHSFEVWREGALVGGLYGVSLGGAFFGESMFSKEANASKVALATLAAHCQAWQMPLIDCQMPTPHLIRMGAKTLAREDFLRKLAAALKQPTRQGRWEYDASLARYPVVSP